MRIVKIYVIRWETHGCLYHKHFCQVYDVTGPEKGGTVTVHDMQKILCGVMEQKVWCDSTYCIRPVDAA
jgi:hypothetical protein